MGKKEKKTSSKLIYDGKIIKVFCDDVVCPNGNKSKREYIKHNGGVCVLADLDGKIALVKQYRYPYDDFLYELPAGKLEIGEKPYPAGLRELEEEVGLKASSMRDFGVFYPTCGYSNEVIYLYVAEGLENSKQHLDEDEFLDVCYFSHDELKKMIQDNTIKDGKTICLLLKYFMSL